MRGKLTGTAMSGLLLVSCAAGTAAAPGEPLLARVAVAAAIEPGPPPAPRHVGLVEAPHRQDLRRQSSAPVVVGTPFDVTTRDRLDALVADLPPRSEASITVGFLGSGEAYVHQPNRALFPASNQKIFTAMGALATLDPAFSFRTELWWHQSSGTLTVVAGGDPTLRRADLADLARQARSVITDPIEVLRVDAGHFTADRMAPGWQDWQMPTYTGPLSTLIVDDNEHRIDAEFLADPDLGNLRLLADELRATGTEVAQLAHGEARPGGMLVAQHHSPPLVPLVATMLQSSDNEIAEALLREIGASQLGEGSTTAGATAVVSALATAGLDIGGQFADGSGLSRHNLTSSRQWVRLLCSATDQAWWAQFVQSLPVAGRSGTLSARLTGPATTGRVSAKTGTIIGGLALSGLIQLPTDEVVVFSIVVNGEDAHLAKPTIDAIVTELAEVDGTQ